LGALTSFSLAAGETLPIPTLADVKIRSTALLSSMAALYDVAQTILTAQTAKRKLIIHISRSLVARDQLARAEAYQRR